ncbi:MAG: GNAT family N-acetyltransferase [Syntrophobacteraceae bacterium]|jgi:ribosomal protein S18 acetylase RimI-like enzyme
MDSVGREVSIRKLKVEDAEAISVIYSLITKTPVSVDFTRLVREHAEKEGHEAHFVAESRGEVVGFMISYILPFGFGAEQCAYIATMGVHPKWMGQGFGAKMTREIFEFYRAQGVTRVYTSARWDASDVLSFCKTMGFHRSDYINLIKRLDSPS